ncbi:MAG: sulfotransferase family 2 domain-containing protein [Burkholderiaceae bacterium]|nr:sulfotransferase family 2 domain-containing protein [Rhodoferax sp.]MCP5285812.1 sulfotransferase family 2 domain-containing protein [Burkholderiaceae bacterium]
MSTELRNYFNHELGAEPWKASDLITFFHAQRTGGSALRHLLGDALGKERVFCTQFVSDFQHWEVVPAERLLEKTVFAGHSNFQRRDLGRRLLPISLVRHPVYRTFSLYYYCKKYPNQFLHHLTESRDLQAFYAAASAKKPNYFHNVCCQRICGKADFELARTTLERDYLLVGCTERMGDFVQVLFDFLGVPRVEVDQRETDHDRYKQHLHLTDFIETLKRKNSEDLKLFEYMNRTYFHIDEYLYP